MRASFGICLGLGSAFLAAAFVGCAPVQAAGISNGVVRLGVLTDMSGTYSDLSGPGAIAQLWSATFTQEGTKVSVRPPSWSPTLRPGESITFGYLGSGTPVRPTDFRLNGSPCSAA